MIAEKPTLHEIAAMSFPASQKAMRTHYNPHWGRPISDDGEKKRFSVRVEYFVYDHETYEVEAFDVDEAEEMARDVFNADPNIPYGAEVDDTDATELTVAA